MRPPRRAHWACEARRSGCPNLVVAEERSDEAIHPSLQDYGLLRGGCHRVALCGDPLSHNDEPVDAPPTPTLSFTTSPSAAISALRGEGRRIDRQMLLPGSGILRLRNFTRYIRR